jgi:K+-transporting ATPase KdpF subunit
LTGRVPGVGGQGMIVVTVAVTVGLFAYLLAALLRPEWF